MLLGWREIKCPVSNQMLARVLDRGGHELIMWGDRPL